VSSFPSSHESRHWIQKIVKLNKIFPVRAKAVVSLRLRAACFAASPLFRLTTRPGQKPRKVFSENFGFPNKQERQEPLHAPKNHA
jgi:hypothetical protein